LFLPVREPRSREGMTVFQYRCLYPRRGITFYSVGADAAGRKSAERKREALSSRGWVKLIRRNDTSHQRVGLVLTHLGDAYARALVGMPGLPSAFRMMKRLHELRDDGDTTEDSAIGGEGVRAWVHETKLAGAAEYGGTFYSDPEQRGRLVGIMDELLPALVRGWAKSVCGWGVWYGLTDAGAKVLRAGEPAAPGKLPKAAAGAGDVYAGAITEALDALRAMPLPWPRDIATPLISHRPTLRKFKDQFPERTRTP